MSYVSLFDINATTENAGESFEGEVEEKMDLIQSGKTVTWSSPIAYVPFIRLLAFSLLTLYFVF